MVDSVVKSITTKLGVMIGVWFASACMVTLATTVTLAKVAFEDNTTAMQGYSDKMAELVVSVETVSKMAVEQRKLSFKDGLRLLEKQSDKMKSDVDDIKTIDIAASSDFCASSLFSDYIKQSNGSDRVSIMRNCEEVNYWMREN